MSSRDAVLASVRANLPKLKQPLPSVPRFDADPPASLTDAFGKGLTRMGGRLLDPGPTDDVLAPVRSLLQQSRLVCSATPEITTQYDLANVENARDLAAGAEALFVRNFKIVRLHCRTFRKLRPSYPQPFHGRSPNRHGHANSRPHV